jgi:hypothetical protein
MQATDRFQGSCFEALDGYQFMNHFDYLAESERKLVRNSRFNLCPACLGEIRDMSRCSVEVAIRLMEAEIERNLKPEEQYQCVES